MEWLGRGPHENYIDPVSYTHLHALNYPFDGRKTSMGYAITAFPSSNIKWETTVYKNIGVDISLWNNKLELSGKLILRTPGICFLAVTSV